MVEKARLKEERGTPPSAARVRELESLMAWATQIEAEVPGWLLAGGGAGEAARDVLYEIWRVLHQTAPAEAFPWSDRVTTPLGRVTTPLHRGGTS